MTTPKAPPVPLPSKPLPRIEPDWFVRFGMQLRTTRSLADFGGAADVILLGDSITENWQWNASWAKVFAGLKVLDYGLGGDKTENLLWRIENGLLNGLRPGVVTLMIGVNNLWNNLPPAAVAAGVIACAQAIRTQLPDARLLHCGILPTSGPAASALPTIHKINAQCAKAAAKYHATWIDLTPDFSTTPGTVKPGLLSDGVHLLDGGYQLWGHRLRPFISKP